jgi:uncharacterized protein DUF2442
MSNETITQENRPVGIKAAAPWRVHAVSVLPDYRLSVTCNDGTVGVVDMSRLIVSEQAGIYAALKDERIFNQVYVDLGAITWPNGVDIDPEWMHEEIGKNKMWCVPG